jgi:hypothetical protein
MEIIKRMLLVKVTNKGKITWMNDALAEFENYVTTVEYPEIHVSKAINGMEYVSAKIPEWTLMCIIDK